MKPLLLATLFLAVAAPAGAEPAPDHPIASAVAAKLSRPDRRFTMVVKLRAKDDAADKLIAAFAEAVPPSRRDNGCSRYELNQVEGEPASFVVYERWATLDNLRAHLAAPHTRKLLAALDGILAAKPEITVLVPKADPPKPKSDLEDKVESGIDKLKKRLESESKDGDNTEEKLKRALESAKDELRRQLEGDD